MKRMFLLSMLLICGCSTVGTKLTATHPCTPNITEQGNFFAGTVFKCSKEYANISKEKAFDKIVSSMAINGYHINNSNKELGLISAALPVTAGKGQTVPMNVVVNKEANKQIKVSATINIPGGVMGGGDETTNYFCTVYNALEN